MNCFLIDDDLDDCEIFCAVWEGVVLNSNCLTAPNGQVALDTLSKGGFLPEIIFLDLNMPLMNGSQFLIELKKRNIFMNIPIVVLTTSANPATREELLELGATDFITKPDKFSDWENLIGQVVANLNSKNGGHS